MNLWDATHTYVHDANGNLTSGDGAKTYKYDAENRLVEVSYVGGTNKSVFTYDGINRRTVVAETVSGTTTTTRYLWCGDRVCQTRNSSDTVLKRLLPEGEFTVSGSTRLVYMQDQLGSVRDVINATTGTRVKSYDYTAYGKVARNNGASDTDYRYAGLWYHPQSGLNLAKYRAQDPATGRWINRDPIREAGGINLYGYVTGNPLNYDDPDGLVRSPRGRCTNPNCGAWHGGSKGEYCPDCEKKSQDPKGQIPPAPSSSSKPTDNSDNKDSDDSNFCDKNPKTCVAGTIIIVGGAVVLVCLTGGAATPVLTR